MRIFHQLAYNAPIMTSGTMAGTLPEFIELFGSVDQLVVSGFTTQVSGTSPTLWAWVQHSPDNEIWFTRATVVSGLSLSTTGETVFQGVESDPDLSPRLKFARVGFSVSGAGSSGFLRLWVTGRDYSRRARNLMAGQQAANTAPAPQAQAVMRR